MTIELLQNGLCKVQGVVMTLEQAKAMYPWYF